MLLNSACSLPPLATWHPASPSAARHGWTGPYLETGMASWYGPGFFGERTSSGEVYRRNDMTAAHPTLPLGTRVLVTNVANGRFVELRINDRGPFLKGRIIDLSRAAARELDLVEPGTAQVRVETLAADAPPGVVAYAVQVGAFQDGANAQAVQSGLAGRYQDVYLSQLRTPDAFYYRVRLGPFDRRDDALVRARQLSQVGVSATIVEEVRP